MLCAGCARHPAPAAVTPRAAPAPAHASAPAPAPAHASAPAPVPAEAPDLSGRWQYTATLGSAVIDGTLTLVRSGASYAGGATASIADDPVPMTAMTVTGSRIVMLFDTPNGEARVEGTVSGGTVISGTVAVGDRTGSFKAQKQR